MDSYSYLFSLLLTYVMAYIYIVGFISILVLVSTWIIYKKAGRAGIASIIPIYRTIVMLEITDLPVWYIFLTFVPIANFIVMLMIYIELAKRFGKSTVFGVLMTFFGFVCLPILAFGSSKYNKNPQEVEVIEKKKYCSYCGHEISDNEPVCFNCGHSL